MNEAASPSNAVELAAKMARLDGSSPLPVPTTLIGTATVVAPLVAPAPSGAAETRNEEGSAGAVAWPSTVTVAGPPPPSVGCVTRYRPLAASSWSSLIEAFDDARLFGAKLFGARFFGPMGDPLARPPAAGAEVLNTLAPGAKPEVAPSPLGVLAVGWDKLDAPRLNGA